MLLSPMMSIPKLKLGGLSLTRNRSHTASEPELTHSDGPEPQVRGGVSVGSPRTFSGNLADNPRTSRAESGGGHPPTASTATAGDGRTPPPSDPTGSRRRVASGPWVSEATSTSRSSGSAGRGQREDSSGQVGGQADGSSARRRAKQPNSIDSNTASYRTLRAIKLRTHVTAARIRSERGQRAVAWLVMGLLGFTVALWVVGAVLSRGACGEPAFRRFLAAHKLAQYQRGLCRQVRMAHAALSQTLPRRTPYWSQSADRPRLANIWQRLLARNKPPRFCAARDTASEKWTTQPEHI